MKCKDDFFIPYCKSDMAKDKTVILRFSRKFLQIQLIWPTKNSGVGYYLKFCVITLLTTPFLLGTSIHLLTAIIEHKNVSVDVDYAVIISLVGMYYFLICYLLKAKKVAEEYEKLSDFRMFGKPPGFEAFNKKMDLYSKINYVYVTSILLVYCYAPLSEYKECLQINEELGLNEICGVINTWVPFDIDYTPMREFVLVFQLFASRYTYSTAALLVFSVWETVEQLIFRFKHLENLLVQVGQGKTSWERRKRFDHALGYHKFLLSSATVLSDCFSNSNLLHLFQSGAILGACGHQTIEDPHLIPISLIGGYFIALAVMSLAGQKLVDQTLSVGETIYNEMEWYRLENDIQKDLVFVLKRCQKPVYLRAGSFGSLNYWTLIMVLKMAYSVLTLLNTLDSS